MNIVKETPDVKEYAELRIAAGAKPIAEETLKRGLDHSICIMTARSDQSELVGMGRIIGDEGCHYQIVDLLVHPGCSESELKEAILNQLLAHLDAHASTDATIMVMSDVAGLKLFQQHGFKLVYPDYYGMTRPVSLS